ncbi:uncharacterized protein LOC100679031 isoform X4 [Nasonia vitripennis]|uniref:THAP-type domain-containing protein n=1 Tax=Nasonia vitripennis TaxID=7425 RepID=A0A7M7HE56_NASVI|nr:uncharacterized protein LOC100679031 isoform X4 [Nasonia vitripennis]
MGNSTCCVVNCKNNARNSSYKFYIFPTAKHWLPQKEKWIAAIKRINPDGSPWVPKKHDVICSAHFIGNKKSQHPLSPSFVPTIFPSEYTKRPVNEKNKIDRNERFIKRNNQNILPLSPISSTIVKIEPQETAFGLVTVAFLWGVTNPFMKKGAEGINRVKSSSKLNQIFRDIYYLVTNLKYMLPFLVNQTGSLLYVLLLQQTDLSLTVVVVNSLTFVITALTGSFLGEEKVNRNTYIGVVLVLLGTMICCLDKMD